MGTVAIGCPLDEVTADVWEALTLTEFMGKGLPPVAGGALDQTENFMRAAAAINAERAAYGPKLDEIG